MDIGQSYGHWTVCPWFYISSGCVQICIKQQLHYKLPQSMLYVNSYFFKIKKYKCLRTSLDGETARLLLEELLGGREGETWVYIKKTFLSKLLIESDDKGWLKKNQHFFLRTFPFFNIIIKSWILKNRAPCSRINISQYFV